MTAQFQLFPALDAATESALTESIRRFGVLVPVLQDQHGRILDGHHRSRIADAIGVKWEPLIVRVTDDDEAEQIARELNTYRRHLTIEQRQEMVAFLAERGHPKLAIADALGVSEGTVHNDLQGLNVETLPDRVQGRDGKSYPRTLPRPMTAKEHRADQRRTDLAEQRELYDTDPIHAVPVRRGDFRQVLADVEPGTVDLILTDPPYGFDHVDLYADLAEHAARWLKPGGSLIAYTGHTTLPDVLDRMRPHLRYWWTLCVQHRLPQRVPGIFVYAAWKPAVWFVNGHREHARLVADTLRTADAADQTRHRWAQSSQQIVPLIEQLTDPDDLIVDPFAGTAAWGEVALGMGRRWIGADLGGATA